MSGGDAGARPAEELEALVRAPSRGRPQPIVADALGFRYPGSQTAALRDVSFRVEPGSLLLVVGPSGSGKSTLARAIAGLAAHPGTAGAAWAGRLWVGNVDVTTEPQRWVAESVGIVFQDPASQLVMDRVDDDVAFGLENRAWPLPAMRSRVREVLGTVGLGGFERRRSARLSGGEQQRLALAGALAPAPGVLVLDEPTSSLDPRGAAAVFDRLALLHEGATTTIVLVEHHVDRAWALADLVLALGPDGSPLDLGTPATVLARSRDLLRDSGIWLPGEGTTDPSRHRRSGGSARHRFAATGAEPILRLDEVRFTYERGTPAVRDLSLELRAGDRVALVGPNGSGKSTLLRLAVGLLPPTAGDVRLLGVDPRRMTAGGRARAAGFVNQDPELGFLADTVAEEVGLGLAPSERRAGEELLERLGLPIDRFGARSPYRLSGGEQRRLSLATALVRRPRLLVLDEPTYGQDRHGHEALVTLLDELVEDRTALLAATHDERFVADATDRRVELADGWIVATEAVA